MIKQIIIPLYCIFFLCCCSSFHTTPNYTIHEQTVQSDVFIAIQDAERDASKEIHSKSWFIGTLMLGSVTGCVGGSLGVATAYLRPQRPSIERFIGKSPNYITTYTYSYMKSMRFKQVIYSSTGCLVGGLIAGIIW